MKTVSKILLTLCICIIIFIFILENDNIEKYNKEIEIIREKLEKKGLPTPAYADLKTLKNILKKHSTI